MEAIIKRQAWNKGKLGQKRSSHYFANGMLG